MISGGFTFSSDYFQASGSTGLFWKCLSQHTSPKVRRSVRVIRGLEPYLVNSVGCLREREPFINELVNEPLSGERHEVKI